MRKPIVYTVGEPAGIGPDIILQLATQQPLKDVVCLADTALMETRAKQLGLAFELLPHDATEVASGQLRVKQVVDFPSKDIGMLNTANAGDVLTLLDEAIDGCVSGEYAAMVTGPVQKSIINEAGIQFSGHTEYLAQRTEAELPVMLLASERLRVALVTTHLPLSEVSKAITQELVEKIVSIVDSDLRAKFGIDQPRLLLCGLNPHAGENGHIGREEIERIIPAAQSLRARGIDVSDPLPADTLFSAKNIDGCDAVISMFHDQGLPVLKALSFGEAANITLGLPINRTSVDHGTALDIAGSGNADIGSLRVAISAAQDMVAAQSKSDE